MSAPHNGGMGIQRAPALATTVLVVALLAGCVPPPPEPPRPATAEEIAALKQAQAREWWDGFAPGEPMPDVDVIEVLPPDEAYARQSECLNEAAIPGVTVRDDGGWNYSGEGDSDDPVFVQVQIQYWICNQQFPVDDSDDYVKSQAELAWIYDFYVERHRPCLASLGFEFVDFPQRERFVGEAAGYIAWVPHDYSVSPMPTAQQWQLIAVRCPLPALLGDLGIAMGG